MAGKWNKRLALRLAVILVVGAACIVGAALYRRSRRPAAAPSDVQQRGLVLVRDLLRRVAATEFGRSRRGALLAEAIGRLLEHDRVVFTAAIGTQALYRREADGYERLYVRVLRLADRWVHQTPEEIAEGLFHEAVHARQAEQDESSIEEECDGYAAGLCAGAAAVGRTLPVLLKIDGVPVADFVAKAYPELPRSPTYQPVGESREWLAQRTGLR